MHKGFSIQNARRKGKENVPIGFLFLAFFTGRTFSFSFLRLNPALFDKGSQKKRQSFPTELFSTCLARDLIKFSFGSWRASFVPPFFS